ncbi:hypothetical protein BpHYR1_039481, partial [Brachionus plicatilis]
MANICVINFEIRSIAAFGFKKIPRNEDRHSAVCHDKIHFLTEPDILRISNLIIISKQCPKSA